MERDNRNNGKNVNKTNRGTGSISDGRRNSYDRDNGGKTVRKVENTRFYERENPESNMRRVGRTASDFDEERRSYDSDNYERRSRTKIQDSGDSIPEFKSFKRSRSDDSVRSVSRRRDDRVGNDGSSEPVSYRRYSDNRKTDVADNQKSGLYNKNDISESEYDFDEEEKSVPKAKRVSATERVAQKREDKKKLAELMARSDDRSHRRRAVSKKRERKIRSMQLLKAAIVLLIIVIVLLITLSKCDYDDPYGTAYVTSGSIEFMSDADVSFIRQEEVCTAPASGILVPAVNEGEKVSAGTTVAYITTEERTELINQLAEIEEKIEAIRKLDNSSSGVMSADVTAIDGELDLLSRELAEATAAGQMEKYVEIKNEIDSLMIKRNELITNSQNGSSYLSSLESERNLIKERISIYTKPVVAKSAGIVSFYIDGNEASFTEYNKLLKENSATDVINISSVTSGEGKNLLDNQVSAGSVVAKVVTSNEYYVAAVAEGSITVQSGKKLPVKSKDRAYVSEIEVVSVSYSAGKTLIIGKTSKSLVSSLGKRMIDGEVITGQYSGMKIPLSSLTEYDSTGTTARLTLVRSNYVVYAYVNILAKDAEYAIISDKTAFSDAVIKDKDGNVVEVDKTRGVSVNDIFVLKPEHVKEGDILS